MIILPVLLSVSACGGAVANDGANAHAGGSPVTPGNDLVEVIDDMDRTDGGYPAAPPGSASFFWRGGLGNWFVTSSDGVSQDAVIDELDPSQGESGKACHVSGAGLGVGVDLWAQLNHPQGRPVDVSAYSAVTFRARLTGAKVPLTVAFGADGQFFHSQAGFASRALSVSEEWQSFDLLFAEFDLETSAVSSIDFVIGQGADPFNLWVDDLAFRCNRACP